MGELLILLAVLALIPAYIGHRKGNSFAVYWVAGVLIFPVALVWSIFEKDKRRRCPHCDEAVSEKASVCPHCQRDISPAADAAGSAPAEVERDSRHAGVVATARVRDLPGHHDDVAGREGFEDGS